MEILYQTGIPLQQDHDSIVTVESKMNLDCVLQPLSERGSEPSNRKQKPVNREICRSWEGDKHGSDRAPSGEARQKASSENRGSGI
jgi:hypothetical protein